MNEQSEIDTPERVDTVDVLTLSPTFNQHVLEQNWSFLHSQELAALGDGLIKLVNTVTVENIDTMFVMDKSARPIGYMLPILMRALGIDHKLDIRFLNLNYFKKRGLEDFFVTPTEQELFRQTFGDLNGKRVCLADAYMDQGKELKRAKNIVTRTFPKVGIVVTAYVVDNFPSWEGNTDLLGIKDADPIDMIDWHLAPERSRPNIFLSHEVPTGQSSQFYNELSQFAALLGQHRVNKAVSFSEYGSYTKEVAFAF